MTQNVFNDAILHATIDRISINKTHAYYIQTYSSTYLSLNEIVYLHFIVSFHIRTLTHKHTYTHPPSHTHFTVVAVVVTNTCSFVPQS